MCTNYNSKRLTKIRLFWSEKQCRNLGRNLFTKLFSAQIKTQPTCISPRLLACGLIIAELRDLAESLVRLANTSATYTGPSSEF